MRFIASGRPWSGAVLIVGVARDSAAGRAGRGGPLLARMRRKAVGLVRSQRKRAGGRVGWRGGSVGPVRPAAAVLEPGPAPPAAMAAPAVGRAALGTVCKVEVEGSRV